MRADLIAGSWLRTKRQMRASPAQLARSRANQWQELQLALARTPALASCSGKPITDIPVLEPREIREDYGAWNSLGLDHETLAVLADRAEQGHPTGRISAGWSTGSGGGARGLFLASAAERADYIGQSLARLLPARALLQRQRLALNLRAGNALYSDVGSNRFAFEHFPLAAPLEETMAGLARFDPTILIAPPHRLLDFARSGLRLPSLQHLFWGSEPMSECERDCIERAFALRPQAIYQATEGFLAAECRHGKLHLNEHAIEFEFEPVPDTEGFRLIVSDLRRLSQPIIRLRLDDYVELEDGTCPCGYVGRIIRPPQGRVQDLWRFADRTVTPPQVIEAVEAVLGCDHDWQAVADNRSVTLHTRSDAPSHLAEKAVDRLQSLARVNTAHRPDFGGHDGPKRRKVVWRDD